MDRDSILYKLRRKGQVIARYIVPLDLLSKMYHFIVLKKKLNLKNPQSFNEKIQWMKLYYCPHNPLVVECSDKYKVREYVKEKGLEHILVKVLGSWLNANEIDFFLGGGG